MDEYFSILLNTIGFILYTINPQPILEIDVRSICQYGQFAFGIVIAGAIYKYIASLIGHGFIPLIIAISFAYLGTAFWQPGMTYFLLIIYAVTAKLLEGVAVGYILAHGIGGLKGLFASFTLLGVELSRIIYIYSIISQGLIVLGIFKMVRLIDILENDIIISLGLSCIVILGSSLMLSMGTLRSIAFYSLYPCGVACGIMIAREQR